MGKGGVFPALLPKKTVPLSYYWRHSLFIESLLVSPHMCRVPIYFYANPMIVKAIGMNVRCTAHVQTGQETFCKEAPSDHRVRISIACGQASRAC